MKLAIKAPKKLKKGTTLKIILVLLILAGAVAIWAWPMGGLSKNDNTLTYTIEEHTVEAGGVTQSISATGTLQAVDSYALSALVSGDILTDTFSEGDSVLKDDVLYTIDSSDSASTIERAEISLESAQRKYETQLENLAKLTVTSDVTGTVCALEVEVGDSVTANQLIATVRDLDNMEITLSFLSDEAQEMRIGDSGFVVMNDTMEQLPATVQSISILDEVTSQNSIIRKVTFTVQNPGGLTIAHSGSAMVDGAYSMDSASFEYGAESEIRAEVAGEVSALYTELGGYVSKNNAILTLTSDTVTENIESAEDTVREAEISLENAMDVLDSYTITSPISGTVVQKNKKAGETLSGSNTTLCTIYDLSSLTMTINIDELDILNIAEGFEVTITSDSVAGASYTGIVTNVSNIGATSGGVTTYPATVEITAHEGLMVGMNVSATIITAQSEGAIKIPVAALNRTGTVLVPTTSPSAKNAVEGGTEAPEGYVYVAVETGLSDGSYIEIVSGLTVEDTVAVQVANRIESDDFTSGFGMTGGMTTGNMPTGGMSSGGMSSGGMSGGGMSGGGRG